MEHKIKTSITFDVFLELYHYMTPHCIYFFAMALWLEKVVLVKYGLIKEVKIVLERLLELKCVKCDYTAVLKRDLDRHEKVVHAVLHKISIKKKNHCPVPEVLFH